MHIQQQLSLGADNMRQIVGDGTYELLQDLTPMKLFFSMLSPIPLEEGKNVANAVTNRFQDIAVVGSNGFIYGDNIYPFTPEYQTLIHRKMIGNLVCDPKLAQNVIASFVEFSSEWRTLFSNLQKERLNAKITDIHKKKVDQFIVDEMNKFDQNSDVTTKKKFFLDSYPSLNSDTADEFLRDLKVYTKQRDALRREISKGGRIAITNRYATKAAEIRKESNRRIKAINDIIAPITARYAHMLEESNRDNNERVSAIKAKWKGVLDKKLVALHKITDPDERKSAIETQRKINHAAVTEECKQYNRAIKLETSRISALENAEKRPYNDKISEEKERREDKLKVERVFRDSEIAKRDKYIRDTLKASDVKFEAEVLENYGISITYDTIDSSLKAFREKHLIEYLVENGYLTCEQFKEYEFFPNVSSTFPSRFNNMAIDKALETGVRVTGLSPEYTKFNLTPIIPPTRPGYMAQIRDALSLIRDCIKIAAGVKYFDEYKGEYVRMLNYDVFFPTNLSAYNRDAVSALAELLPRKIARFKRLMAALLHKTREDEVDAMLQEYITLCERYYNDLFIPYMQGKAIYGGISSHGKAKIRLYANKVSESLESKRSSVVDDVDDRRFNVLMDTICTRLLGVSKEQSANIIMLPTGFILVDPDKGIAVKGFHPLDQEVKSIMNKSTWVDWVESWEQFWRKISKLDYRNKFEFVDQAVRDVINGQLEKMFNELETLNPVEERVRDMQRQYSFTISPLIKKSGLFNYGINAFSLQIIEELIPKFHKYIESVVLADFSFKVSEVPDKIKQFVFNGHDFISIMINQSDRLTLNIPPSMTLDDVDLGVFAHIIGMKLYQTMNNSTKAVFHTIAGDGLNISKMDLYRVTDIRVDSHADRRQCMSRLIFIREFVKYVLGEADNTEYVEFFREYIDPITNDK